MIGGRSVVAIVSADELEIRQGGENLVCKYTKQDNKLRVIVNALGTTTAKYFDLAPQGLVDEDGDIYYEPEIFQKITAQIQLNTELVEAVKRDDAVGMDALIAKGASVETRNASGTVLMIAIEGGLTKAVASLLKNGANPNVKVEGNESTPLSKAVAGGRDGIVELLLKSGANPNERSADGTTPLMLAASWRGGWGGTPRTSGHNKILSVLCENKVDLNLADNEGNTALMLSLMNNNLEATKVLVAAGADRSIRNSDGLDALSYAKDNADMISTLQTAAEVEAETVRLKAKADAEHRMILSELQANPPVAGEGIEQGVSPFLLRAKKVDVDTGVVLGELEFFDEDLAQVITFEGQVTGTTFEFVCAPVAEGGSLTPGKYSYHFTLSEDKMDGAIAIQESNQHGELVLWFDKEKREYFKRLRDAMTPTKTIATASLARPSSDPDTVSPPTATLTDTYLMFSGRFEPYDKYKFTQISKIEWGNEYNHSIDVTVPSTRAIFGFYTRQFEFTSESERASFYTALTNAFAAWSVKHSEFVFKPKQ